MFVNFFIRRPVFATVCSLLIVLAGAVSIPTLPIAQFPDLAPPQVTVSAFYTGANSQAVETSVTTLLEQAINGAQGMHYSNSTSSNDGSSSVTATFDLDRNLDLAAVDIQNRASTALGRLPVEVQTTGLNINKNSGSFVMFIAFYSDNNQYDDLFISNYIDVYVKDALKRIKGVGDALIFGERKYSMRLWLDPVRLAARGLTPSDVTNALREQNVQVAAGQVGLPPVAAGQNYQISVRAVGRLSDPKDFERIIVKRATDGTLVELRDVGRAELGAESYGGSLRYNGNPITGFGVQQLSTANAIDVDREVRAELARLSQRFPPGLKYQVAFDTTTAVGDSIREVLKTLSAAIVIVIIVIFLFLQGWRSTIIPAITIPVSLVGTFIFAKLFGFSINTLTLFGITLATGLVVDDAIVVIENVERHMEEGVADPAEATRMGMKEVTGAVIATSLVLIAVFVPVSLFPGTSGRLYQQFALTIAFSIAISAFNALTLSPALAALLLRPRVSKNKFFGAINAVIHHGSSAYEKLLGVLASWRFAVIVVFLAGLAATYWVYTRVPSSFLPAEDQGYFISLVQAPPGSSLEYTERAMDKASAIISKNPDVQGVFSIAGFSGGAGGATPNQGILFASLKNISERHGVQHSAGAVIDALRGPLFGVSEAFVFPVLPPSIQGLGQYGGFQFELQQASGSAEDLEGVLQQLIQKGSTRKELKGLFSSFTARDPQIVVQIDREKAKSLGVPFSQITSTLQIYMGSQYVNDFDFNNRAYRVFVQADRQFRSQPRDLRQFYVRSDDGRMISLDNLVTIAQGNNAGVITHYNLFRNAEINGSAAPGYSSGQAIKAMEELASEVLPVGYSFSFSGLSLEEIQSGSKSLLFFGLGLLVVYLTLSAQYESFVLPFIILLAVPMAILGALAAQKVRGLENDVYCQIGLVMLIGLASKNAILIVEFAEQLQHRGTTLVQSAIQAARLRLRPILMTSLAFILGVLPLVFATGAGAEGRHSVGTTVFGGMIVSTFLNLFIIPVLYVVVRGWLPMRSKSETPEG